GNVTSWEYYRANLDTTAYVAVWRPMTSTKFMLVKKTILPATPGGRVGVLFITLPQDQKIPVKVGDFIGVHYSRYSTNAAIPNSRGGDGDVSDSELFRTINVARYDEDLQEGNVFDFANANVVKSTYAIIANVEVHGTKPPTTVQITTPTTPSLTMRPGECPPTVGRVPTDLPRRGGNWAHLMIDNEFLCSGTVIAWEYYRDNMDTVAYVATWRPTAEPWKFKLITKTPLSVRFGYFGVTKVDVNIPVQGGDFIGIHYSYFTGTPCIPNSRGNDSVVPDNELYTTINVPRFNEDFVEGNIADFTGVQPIKSTYALRAIFNATGRIISTRNTQPATSTPGPIVVQECKYSEAGREYMGKKATTRSGRTCQMWVSQFPHEHNHWNESRFPDARLEDTMNYCRNPTYNPGGVWCFTTDTEIRWEYCDVAYCDCKATKAGMEYNGKVHTTREGYACQRWDSQVPNKHPDYDPQYFPDGSVKEAGNKCRNPTNFNENPWCHTTNASLIWQYCDIPVCECSLSPFAHMYLGKTAKTISGRTCQRWDSQSPHPHDKYDPALFPESTIEEASNYCRNPTNNPGGAWCYTTDVDVEWEYCDIPLCGRYQKTVPPTPKPSLAPGTCPDMIGRHATDLPRSGGTYAHLMIDNSFPCDGSVSGFFYFKSSLEAVTYVGIWRPVNGKPNMYQLIYKQRFPSMLLGQIGVHYIPLATDESIEVKIGDFLGVHFPQQQVYPGIPNSRGNDSVVPDDELFTTINIARYDEDFIVGNTIDFTGAKRIKSTFALNAVFTGIPPQVTTGITPTQRATKSPPPICPKNGLIGGPAENLPEDCSTYMHLMLNDSFPCDGYITGFEYFRTIPNIPVYVGIWRNTRTLNIFKLIKQVKLQDSDINSKVTTTLKNKISVQKHDFIGLYYDKDASDASIPCSGERSILYRTLTMISYAEDVKEGGTLDAVRSISSLKTFAISAKFQGKKPSLSAGGIVGIVFACLFVVLLLAGITIYVMRSRGISLKKQYGTLNEKNVNYTHDLQRFDNPTYGSSGNTGNEYVEEVQHKTKTSNA
ncbi:unnamed protein product, partial [Owenia fusiformis]